MKNSDPILFDLNIFTIALTAAFVDTDRITRKLESLTMTGRDQEYVRQFCELSAKLGYNDVALRGQFVGGLPDSINNLLLSMPPPATFDISFGHWKSFGCSTRDSTGDSVSSFPSASPPMACATERLSSE